MTPIKCVDLFYNFRPRILKKFLSLKSFTMLRYGNYSFKNSRKLCIIGIIGQKFKYIKSKMQCKLCLPITKSQ